MYNKMMTLSSGVKIPQMAPGKKTLTYGSSGKDMLQQLAQSNKVNAAYCDMLWSIDLGGPVLFSFGEDRRICTQIGNLI